MGEELDEKPPITACDYKIVQDIYFKVVEASPDAQIIIDCNGIIVVFNTQAELMFGYERNEILGKPLEILLPENQRSHHVGHRTLYFQEPKTREMGTGQTLLGRHRNGDSFPIQIKLAPLMARSAGVHALAVVRRVRTNATD